jgi:putative transposase
MIYPIIHEYACSKVPISYLCSYIGISRAGYYHWLKRVPRNRDYDTFLIQKIHQIYIQSKSRYGYRKIQKALILQFGEIYSPGTVYKIMRENGLKSNVRKKYKVCTTNSKHNNPIAPREFKIEDHQITACNMVWAGDITYIPTEEGFLYLSVFLDLYSRKVVGWDIDNHLKAELVTRSLLMGLQTRTNIFELIIHTDRGVQYTAGEYTQMLQRHQIKPSMSRKGNCYDNAYVESFFALLKKELGVKVFKTKKEAQYEIAEFITVWYNNNRIHSAIGYLSPSHFESINAAAAA